MDEKTLKKLADAYKQGNPEAKKAIDNLKKLALGQGEEAEKAKSILTAIQGYIKKAAKGAKLDYIKSLKHQCTEDEELYYYKKGGSVGCGCKKKEDGGEVVKANMGIVANFKEDLKKKKQQQLQKLKQLQKPKQDQATRDSLRINSTKGDDELEANRPGNYKPNPKHNPKDPNSKTHIWVPDRTKEPYNKDKVKKNCSGSVIKKFKIHRLGGSLNGIPFIRKVNN